MSKLLAPLVITPGEPGGVGFEISAKAWMALHTDHKQCFALLADIEEMSGRLQKAALTCPLEQIATIDAAHKVFKHALPVLQRKLAAPVQPGAFSAATAQWVMAAIEEATNMCFDGTASGMVTNPIQKEALYAAGFKHQGHTDFLAHLCAKKGHQVDEVMMLVGEGLRAVPVTVHIPLKDVPHKLTQGAIVAQARTVECALKTHFGISTPRLAVTGLNPHAGENGSMGREEIDIIIPALQELRAQGVDIAGPLPADTAFFPEARASYDAILCMYHDQALIPVKTLDFHGGVNVTLGLPFIRTSPDHGTALGLAGTGKAKAESLIAAIRLAANMAATAHAPKNV